MAADTSSESRPEANPSDAEWEAKHRRERVREMLPMLASVIAAGAAQQVGGPAPEKIAERAVAVARAILEHCA